MTCIAKMPQKMHRSPASGVWGPPLSVTGRVSRRVPNLKAAQQTPGRARPAAKPTARYAPPAHSVALTDVGARPSRPQHERSRGCLPQTRTPCSQDHLGYERPPKRRELPRHQEKPQRTTIPGMPRGFSDHISQKAPGPRNR